MLMSSVCILGSYFVTVAFVLGSSLHGLTAYFAFGLMYMAALSRFYVQPLGLNRANIYTAEICEEYIVLSQPQLCPLLLPEYIC